MVADLARVTGASYSHVVGEWVGVVVPYLVEFRAFVASLEGERRRASLGLVADLTALDEQVRESVKGLFREARGEG